MVWFGVAPTFYRGMNSLKWYGLYPKKRTYAAAARAMLGAITEGRFVDLQLHLPDRPMRSVRREACVDYNRVKQADEVDPTNPEWPVLYGVVLSGFGFRFR